VNCTSGRNGKAIAGKTNSGVVSIGIGGFLPWAKVVCRSSDTVQKKDDITVHFVLPTSMVAALRQAKKGLNQKPCFCYQSSKTLVQLLETLS